MESLKHIFSSVFSSCNFNNDFSNTDKTSQVLIKSNTITLNLVVIKSKSMPISKVFSIEPAGLINTERPSNGDNCVYAGSLHIEESQIVNDIILPENEIGIGSKNFVIQFKAQPSPAYHLKDLGNGSGTFIKITKPIELKSNYILSFGMSKVILNIKNKQNPEIILIFIDGPNDEEKLNFFDFESPITIGKNSGCSLRINDDSLGRFHSIISFKEKWIIEDGDQENQNSIGTWLFVEDFFEIYDGMIMKAGDTSFSAELCCPK